MRKLYLSSVILILFSSCNLNTEEYSLIYTDEVPNEAFAKKLEQVLEESYYNVDFRLNQTSSAKSIIDSLEAESIDMALVENFVNYGEGIRTVVPVFPKILHIFYHKEIEANSIENLFYGHDIYIGKSGSASYDFMMRFFDFYQLDVSRIKITNTMLSADVMAIFSIIMSTDELLQFKDYKLYSLGEVDEMVTGSDVEGIVLRYPRVRPYVIPKRTYGELTKEPIVTICTDMVFVVREGMLDVTISDLIRSLFSNKEKFVHVNPSFYYGIIENFDRAHLSYPLHEGARAYLDRDEPGFLERYAELFGVIFTVIIAFASGVVSFGNWRKQKKKDKIDVFYAHLMGIKNGLPNLKTVKEAQLKIGEIKSEQNRAFKMLINEELSANESFRIYMELSKETIGELTSRAKAIMAKTNH
jgi:TRAP-type uncharacterized transport system substrate-binding protein